MPTHEQELMRAARAVARYQATIRGLRKRIKEAQAGLRLEQKHLRALATMHGEQTAPSRLFGEKVAAGKLENDTRRRAFTEQYGATGGTLESRAEHFASLSDDKAEKAR